jgi:DNA-binding winged helix-turn-helix (wHTH) protein
MLKLGDLALRPDLQLGPMLVSPSRRLVEGPGGHTHLEPLIMQVFLLLLDAGGKVVTRNELFDQCWGGVIVGDDSLNRAIAKVRRTSAHVAPGLLEIETIPRTGYRLTGEILELLSKDDATSPGREAPQAISRRRLVGGAAATAAALGAGGIWFFNSREDREFKELMDRGEDAQATSDPDSHPAEYFRRAVALRPADAKAQGSLAYAEAIRTDNGQPDQTRAALQEAESAATAALALDPNEPNAQLARIILQSSSLDLAGTEDRLRRILGAYPDSINAMKQLWNLLQCVGRSREALALVERSLAIKPLASGSHYPRAQLLWITGRTAEADRVIERAMQYWPTHRFVRFARFIIFAFTDRPRAALAMIEKPETAPQNYSPEAIALWRVSLPALDQRTPASIAAARKANLEAVKKNLRLTSQATMVMSALGEIDTAFEIANAFFAVGGSNESGRGANAPVKSTALRFAPWLFIPPIAPMRADPRFQRLVEGIGLSDYWKARNVRPDYLKQL